MSESKPEYVYLLEAVGGGWVKIGRSKDPFGRIADLQTGCPYPIVLRVCFHCPNAFEVESRLHDMCAAYRGHGEWFAIDSAIVQEMLHGLRKIAYGTKEWVRERVARNQWIEELEGVSQ